MQHKANQNQSLTIYYMGGILHGGGDMQYNIGKHHGIEVCYINASRSHIHLRDYVYPYT